MEYRGHQQRMQQHELPREPTACNLGKPCVYRESGVCDQPWINKGNGDAACHKMGNRAIYALLDPIEPEATPNDR